MRSIWSGSLSFGLINIPIKIYGASEERALKFRLLQKDSFCPIHYLKVCRDTGKEVEWKDIVKGYEYGEGNFVVLTDDDFQKASPKKTKSVEIINFTDEADVPAKYMVKPYYIEPDKKAEKAYVLLRKALQQTKKAGIARFVLKDKEHLAMIKPDGNNLLMIQLRFEEEIRKPEDLHIPDNALYSKKELDIALMLILELEENFRATDYKDTFTDEIRKIIEKKAKGKPIRIKEEMEPVPTDMRDLMNILKASLEKAKGKQKTDARS